ncbi:hypothetical protein HYT55_00495 [Candidatus Woesearchaeota archaeon]|nr:hypothetical protein [Candidatus Woesearchaeota archaeon]
MSFLSTFRLSLFGEPRVRGYVHDSQSGDTQSVQRYCTTSLAFLHQQGMINLSASPASWYIGLVWYDSSSSADVLDLFHFSNYQGWPGNPDVRNFVVHHGVYQPGPITCTQGIILLGQEEQLRRRTSSLEHYLQQTVDLDLINKLL